jgi:hypothetical protein
MSDEPGSILVAHLMSDEPGSILAAHLMSAEPGSILAALRMSECQEILIAGSKPKNDTGHRLHLPEHLACDRNGTTGGATTGVAHAEQFGV